MTHSLAMKQKARRAPWAELAHPAADDAAGVDQRPVLPGDEPAAHAEHHRDELAPEGPEPQQPCTISPVSDMHFSSSSRRIFKVLLWVNDHRKHRR